MKGHPQNNASKARMGLPIFCGQIVQRFKNIVSQCAVQFPDLTTAHNITKRFKESGKISALMGRGQKPAPNHQLRNTEKNTD